MSDTPPRKPGVPTLTTIGYAGSLTGKNTRPPAGGVSPSTQQGFAPVLPDQLRALEILEQASPRKTPPYPAPLPAPLPPAAAPEPPPVAAWPPIAPPAQPPRAAVAPAAPAIVAPVAAPPVAAPPIAAAGVPLAATTTTPRERARPAVPAALSAAARPRPPSSPGFDEAMTSVWKQIDTSVGTDEIGGQRRFLRWWLLLPVLPLVAVFAYLLFGSPEPLPAPASSTASTAASSSAGPVTGGPAQAGDSVVIGRGTIALRVQTAGQVRGLARADIFAELEGVVAEVHVQNGQPVKQGERLLTFDVASSRKQLRALSQAVIDRKAELHVQRLRRDAIRRDLRSGLLWPAEMEAAEAELKQAEARLRAATAARRRAQERARSSALEAPMDGVVSGLAVAAGQKVTPRAAATPGKPLLTIEDPGKVLVAADLPADAATRVAVDSPARVIVAGLADSAFDAQLVGIPEAPIKNDAGATVYPIELRVDVGADAAKVAPGTTTTVSFHIGQKKDVLVLPLTAVKTDNAGRTVEVWSSELMQYERRVVQTGEHDETHVEVIGNLAEGDRVRILTSPSKG